ncbi:MAG: hypothetical protein GT601_16300 [Acidaminobacter sp.]|uniref:DsbA family protein n=1 Tax=Acidaminobacter sp. TaxID=1872102 RepID=UPI001381CA92|nr:DsbA family protein [Acidaminobacter sp.]MZQ99229.1 hypothetical protein [Acidaminobacter sp.]
MNNPKVKILYFTDPYCSWCWATDPMLFTLKEHYGDQIEIQHVMGGLVKDMSTFSDGHNHISTASAVLPHWRMVSERSGQPIDENLWLEIENYPHFSTWPANVAAKAAGFQGKEIGEQFLRRIRRAALTERKIVSHEEVLLELVKDVEGMDLVQFKNDLNSPKAQQAFQDDLDLCRTYGVTGFPSMLFYTENTAALEASASAEAAETPLAYLLNGYKTMRSYEKALKLLSPEIQKRAPKSVETLLTSYGPLTTREFAEIYETEMSEMETILQEQSNAGKISAEALRGGTLWFLK